jgi:hypothetical protein
MRTIRKKNVFLFELNTIFTLDSRYNLMLGNSSVYGSTLTSKTEMNFFCMEFGSNLCALFDILDAVFSELFLFSRFSSQESF